MTLGITYKSNYDAILEQGKASIVERDKKTVIESIVRTIREKPDEIIQWVIRETPDGGLKVGGFIDFNKPKNDDAKPNEQQA